VDGSKLSIAEALEKVSEMGVTMLECRPGVLLVLVEMSAILACMLSCHTALSTCKLSNVTAEYMWKQNEVVALETLIASATRRKVRHV
jgi:hypothetical protein